MLPLLVLALEHLQITHWNKALQPYRNNIENQSTIMVAFWLGIHNLS